MKMIFAGFLLLSQMSAFAIAANLSERAIDSGVRIASYNIRNFDYDQRSRVPTNKQELAKTLKEIDFDFLGVQEINKVDVFANFIDRNFFGKYKVALSECGGAHGQRLGFVYDKSLFQLVGFEEDMRVSNPHSPNRAECDQGSRPLAVGTFRVKTTGKLFVAVSLHLKSGGQDRSIRKRFKQLEILGRLLAEKRSMGINHFVAMGDFNSTEYIFDGRNTRKFESAVQRMGLMNLSSELSCTAYWWGGRPDGKQYPSQLDHILISNGFQNILKSNGNKSGRGIQTLAYGHCKKLSCSVADEGRMGEAFEGVSDHCPIVSHL